MPLSDRLSFTSEDTELILLDNGRETHRVDCSFDDIARDTAKDMQEQMLEKEDDYDGTVEEAIDSAKYVMNWTKIFSGMGKALGQAAVASERMSRSPL